VKALTLREIHKCYGELEVLKGLNLEVEEGTVYGFLGRNGAGKSTALRTIMGITYADMGEIELLGETLASDDPKARQQVGYVAQEQNFYDWMTTASIGRFVAGFYPSWDNAEYKRLIKLLEIPTGRKIRGFSGGNHAKLALALALATRPRLLLLDEPTAGMDAVARREFIDIVREQARNDQRTTLFSSHLIDEVERAADRVGVMDMGKMRFEGTLDDLRNCVRRYVYEPGRLQSSLAPSEWTAPTVVVDDMGDAHSQARNDVAQTQLLQVLLGERVDVAKVLRSEALVVGDQRPKGQALIVELPAGLSISEHVQLPMGWRREPISLEDIFVAMVGKQVTL